MQTLIRKLLVWIGALMFVTTILTSMPTMSNAMSVAPGDNSQVEPDGTCELCWAEIDVISESNNTILVIYFEDKGQNFSGDFELELILRHDDQRRYVTIQDVSMRHQETQRFVVEAGADWTWHDVSEIRVKALPR